MMNCDSARAGRTVEGKPACASGVPIFLLDLIVYPSILLFRPRIRTERRSILLGLALKYITSYRIP